MKEKPLVLDKTKYLIIDEADEMLNMGFIDEVEAIIKELPSNRVTMVFSATLPKDVENLCYKYMKNPINIEIASTGITTDTIEHRLIKSKKKKRFHCLKTLQSLKTQTAVLFFAEPKNMSIQCLPNWKHLIILVKESMED